MYRRCYQWTLWDRAMALLVLVGAVLLLYYTQVSNDAVDCSEDYVPGSFGSTSVTVLRRTCPNADNLFALLIAVAFALQWLRALMAWELNQEARVMLVKPSAERHWTGERALYHLLSACAQCMSILFLVLIMGQNAWVYLALALGYELAVYTYLTHSPNDEEREKAVHRTSARDSGPKCRGFILIQ